MTATKFRPGDDTHLTLLMAPHSLNFVTGADHAALLAYGRDVFAAARDSKCLAQIEEPAKQITGIRDAVLRGITTQSHSIDSNRVTIEHSGRGKNALDELASNIAAEIEAAAVAAPALDAPAAPVGEVVCRWQALDFSGYCYGSNPPEDLPARCNLTPFYRQPDAYRAALHEISATGNLTATGQQFARHLKQIARDALAAAPHAPAQEAPDTPAQHQGMTIAGNGAAELGKLMREQRDSRMGVYPDGNPNSGQP